MEYKSLEKCRLARKTKSSIYANQCALSSCVLRWLVHVMVIMRKRLLLQQLQHVKLCRATSQTAENAEIIDLLPQMAHCSNASIWTASCAIVLILP